MKEIKELKNLEKISNLKEYLNKYLLTLSDNLPYNHEQFKTAKSNDSRLYRDMHSEMIQIGRFEIEKYLKDICNSNKIFLGLHDENNTGSYSKYKKGEIFVPISFSIDHINLYCHVKKPEVEGLVNNHIVCAIDNCTLRIVYQKVELDKRGRYILKGDSIKGSSIYTQDLQVYLNKLTGSISIDDLSKKIKTLCSKIEEQEDLLKGLKDELSNYKYVKSFMEKSKIKEENISSLKSKMIIDSLEENEEDKESLLTDIQEIVSLELQ